MILADILQWFLLILGAFLTLNAHWLGAHALAPELVTRAHQRYVASPVKVTLVGLAIATPVLALAIGVGNAVPHPVVKALCAGLGLLTGLLALIGSAGLAERVGLGLPGERDAQQPWRRVMRGGALLGLAFLMPFLGWFVLLPWTLISGLGAWALAGRAAAPVRPSVDAAPNVANASATA